jgi:hypothetical protein
MKNPILKELFEAGAQQRELESLSAKPAAFPETPEMQAARYLLRWIWFWFWLLPLLSGLVILAVTIAVK